MDVFILKLILSFFVGGTFVGVLSILAERYKEISGAVIGFPSTLAISLLFIGWTQSIEAAFKATTIIPISLGIMLVFILTYIYIAQKFAKLNRNRAIFLSSVVAVVVWFILSIIVIQAKIDFFYSLVGFFVIFLPIVYLGRAKGKTEEKEEKVTSLASFGRRQLLVRSVFSGFVILLAVLLSNILDPAWGGVFSVFPAAYFSSLTILHYKRGEKFLGSIRRTAPIGAMTLLIYALLVRYFYPILDIVAGTVFAYSVCGALLISYWRLKYHRSRHQLRYR